MVVAEAGCATWPRSASTTRPTWSSARSRLGTTSMTSQLAIERAGEPVAEGELRHVFVDRAGARRGGSRASVRRGLDPYMAQYAI